MKDDQELPLWVLAIPVLYIEFLSDTNTEDQKLKSLHVLSVKFPTPSDLDMQTKNQDPAIPYNFTHTSIASSQSNKCSVKKKAKKEKT